MMSDWKSKSEDSLDQNNTNLFLEGRVMTINKSKFDKKDNIVDYMQIDPIGDDVYNKDTVYIEQLLTNLTV